MKLIIAGSRTFDNYQWMRQEVHRFSAYALDKEIVSGGAQGADKLGERLAKENGLPLKIFHADWGTHRKRAGLVRNELMANYATHLIAFWDGESKGTEHMIITAHRKGLEVKVCLFDVPEPHHL